ncbi:PREDICTED: testis-expressed sequence 11 protein [Gekko japonicus]|uniref:Protein ZIP4 homolog n=1 Tax=Gekko japonicus TaxID=146911 RepID=A0ABM1JSH4_GEKJA|nr:PREDICTED: testis-expressed sequence 11 protein [Gekko japonicus]
MRRPNRMEAELRRCDSEMMQRGRSPRDGSQSCSQKRSRIEGVHQEPIEESAVNLWNWTVMRKMGPTISDLQRIKLRHIACKLMMFCEVSDPPEEMVRRQILMAMKTGKGWVDVGNLTLANEFLEIAMNSLEKLYAQLTKRSTSEADTHIHKADVEKDVFRVLSYQAESAVAEGDFQKAVTCVQRCKDILMRLPKESCYLSLLCYNFGVETYELKGYEQSSFWLSQSYEIGKMDKTYSPGQEMLARVLRLLATVYLEWDYKEYQDKAIRAITMANEENLHPAGDSINFTDSSCPAVTELLHHKFSLDIFLDTTKLLLEHEREAIGFNFLKSVTQLFEGSPDVGKAILLHIELLLQRMKEPLAKKMIEDITASHNTRKQLTPEILNHLHHVLWDRAAKNYEMKRYSEALSWYKYSLSFYSTGQIDQNLAKLQRNMAACYLHLEQFEKAHESVKEAERCDPNSIFTQFYVYKIAVLEKKSQKAFDAIVAMGKSAVQLDTLLTDGVMATSLLSLTAQIALENEQQSVAIKALELLSQLLQDNQQALTALKCLIRLVLSKITVKSQEEITNDMETLLTYLTAALQRLDAPIREESKTLDTGVSEAHWFRKIAWNLAVQCENCPRAMRDFFVISFKFSQFCPPDKAVLLAQRTCLLMAAAVDLDMGRNNLLPTDQQTELLTQALKHIQSCREIWKVLKQTGDFPKDRTDTLLLLYEFEARAKLNDLSIGSLLDKVWELPEVDIKTLETIASLAMESPAHYPSVCKRALKMVLTLLRKQEPTDIVTFSKCLHSLVCLSLPSGITEADTYVLEEAWGYFEDALRILGNTVLQASYPQVEIIWLMTRAWNTGIYQYSTGRYKEAEQWCGLGMRFLGHLGTLKSSYESQMTGLYSEVLDKLDNTKRFLPKEE